MLSKKWVLIAALVLVAALALAACSAAGQQVVTVVVTGEAGEPVVVTATPAPEEAGPVKDTIVICMGQEPDSLLRMTSNMAVEVNVEQAMGSRGWDYDTAFFYYTQMMDEFPSFENGQAEITDDVLTVTYKFKDGITWSDGTPFTVDDILFTKDVVLDPNSGATATGSLGTLTLEKVDDTTLKVTYPKGVKDPTYFLPPLTSAQSTGSNILPKHALESIAPADLINSDFARQPDPVLGPYHVTEWVEGDHISLDAVDNWWGGEVKTPHLIFRFIPDSNQLMASLLSGECDMGTDDGMSITQVPFLQQSASRGLISYSADPGTVWEHLDFNTWPVDSGKQIATPFFADGRVRQAVAYGTNRQQMTEEILFGEVTPLNSYLPSDHWAYNPELDGSYAFDPDKAKSLLAEAGWEDKDGDGTVEAQSALSGDYSCGRGKWSIPAGTPFNVTFWLPVTPSMRGQLATIFQSNMKDIGINVTLNQVPAATMFADGGPLYTRTPDLFEFAWVAGPDPGYLLTYGGENVYGWDPAKFPDLKPGDTGPFLVAGKILEQNPDILKGTGITEEMFKWGIPVAADAGTADASKAQFDPAKLPDGLTYQVGDQIPETRDNFTGSNDPGYCSEDQTQAMFDGENVLDPQDRLPYTQNAQKLMMDDLPILPLFQRLKVDAWAKNLCGIQSGPANYITWNVETWYFAADGEECPAASE